ncbi:MAG TPA: hypothetical protein VEX11_07855 [Acetobacteraceae bacterium]|nr:hypothetical protein [Acetobacteraceae bacterium]
MALAVTLLLCAAHGVMTTRGVSAPPDQDALRDIGFAQALLDGNWFGDPSYPGALRYYPPLLSVLAAVAAALSGAGEDLPGFWVSIGPWVNLAVPLCFFLMARRLLGGAAAGAAACLVFVLWNGAAGPPSAMGGYSPWLFAPGFAQAFFFLAILLIHARVAGGRLRDAALIGGAIGLAFLAHIVPAVVLVVVVTATAFAVQGLRPRTVVWLSVVAAAQLATVAPYLLPAALLHSDGVVNHVPAWWVAPFLRLDADAVAYVVLLNLPGAAAAALLWRRRLRGTAGGMDRRTAVILLSWAGACIVALGRHYACEAVRAVNGAAPSACSVFVLTIHHYHLYLQVAAACALGYAASLLLPRRRRRAPAGASMPPRPPRASTVLALGLAGVVGGTLFLSRPYDRALRALALDHPDGYTIDLAAYRWVLANTAPGDLFVTRPSEGGSLLDPAVFTVIASGRAAAAVPPVFSNPFVRWEERDALRRRFLSAVSDAGTPMPCAPAGQPVWLMLPVGSAVDPGRASPVFEGRRHTISRVAAPACAS